MQNSPPSTPTVDGCATTDVETLATCISNGYQVPNGENIVAMLSGNSEGILPAPVGNANSSAVLPVVTGTMKFTSQVKQDPYNASMRIFGQSPGGPVPNNVGFYFVRNNAQNMTLSDSIHPQGSHDACQPSFNSYATGYLPTNSDSTSSVNQPILSANVFHTGSTGQLHGTATEGNADGGYDNGGYAGDGSGETPTYDLGDGYYQLGDFMVDDFPSDQPSCELIQPTTCSFSQS